MKRITAAEWAKRSEHNYTSTWEPTPWNLSRVEAGELPAEYIGKRNMLVYDPMYGTVLLTEGINFVIVEN